ncbi:MAG: hypothetical protein LJU34_01580 [Oscillospiraceae bacterium]|nr:hypothetical protein [Oscillospiraceae bacterium]
MTNPTFLLKRMKSTNYRGFIDSAKRISKINHRPWPVNLADCLLCTAKYGSGHVDYETFEMYNMTAAERANVLTIGKNSELVKRLNDPTKTFYFDDKAAFDERFNQYLKRDWFCLKDHSYEEFAQFLQGREKIIAKPLDQSCGRGVDVYYMAEQEPKALYDRLMAEKAYLIEEVVTQCDAMAALCPSSVNTVRLVTILNGDDVSIVAGFVRMGRGDSVVDNFNHGGLSAIADTSRGVLVTEGFDKYRNSFSNHPDTGTAIKGFRIPMWEESKALVTEAARVVPEVRYVGWDVAISRDSGPLLIEGNNFPGQDAGQYPKLNLGTYSVMLSAIQ